MEFPDEDLLTLLAAYGELKSKQVRHLHFTVEGFRHIENGIRIVDFNKIERNTLKRIVVGGLEIFLQICRPANHVPSLSLNGAHGQGLP